MKYLMHGLVNFLGRQYLIVFHSLRILGVYKTEHYMSFCSYLRLSPCAWKEKSNNYKRKPKLD